MTSFRRLDPRGAPWGDLDGFPDRTLFQTLPWLDFLKETQKGEIVVAVIEDGQQVLGYFTGMIVKKIGFKILGSPFKGWTTVTMGFNLDPSACYRSVLEALPRFAFGELGCHYLEILDPEVREGDLAGLGYVIESWNTYEIDLTQSKDQLFAAMKSACRRAIRKAHKSGVVIEVAEKEGFADEYYTQLRSVFARQSLVPTYSLSRVDALIRNTYSTGHLLLLRARDRDGTGIAAGIFPGFNKRAYFWGGASLREHVINRPNEALMWHAIQYWKNRGLESFDLGGAASYKRKYGGRPLRILRLMRSRIDGLIPLRNAAKRAFRLRQNLAGLIRRISVWESRT